MYAVFAEVNASEAHIEAARRVLPQHSEDEARQAAAMFRVGEPPMPNAPEGVTVKTVEVREVRAAV